MNNTFILFIIVTVLFLIEIVLGVIMKRNKYKSELKRKSKDIFVARIESFMIIPGRPTLYIVDVEYEENQKRKNRRIFTHGKFAKKYEHSEEVRIVAIPETDMVFLEEESWKEINTVLRILFSEVAIFLVLFLGAFICSVI